MRLVARLLLAGFIPGLLAGLVLPHPLATAVGGAAAFVAGWALLLRELRRALAELQLGRW
jgi:hypothetical protein